MDASFWIALASLVVAAGGLTVAVFGYRSNSRAIRREQSDRKEQIDAVWAGEWAAQRPLVFPVALTEWLYAREGTRYQGGNGRVLPLKNGGRGPALNVRGEVRATSSNGGKFAGEILAGTIAANDLLDARIAPQPGIQVWSSARGAVRYSDLAGNRWETRFEFSQAPGDEVVVTADQRQLESEPAASDGPVSADADVGI